MRCVLNWISRRIRVRSRDTQPYLEYLQKSGGHDNFINKVLHEKTAYEIDSEHRWSQIAVKSANLMCHAAASTGSGGAAANIRFEPFCPQALISGLGLEYCFSQRRGLGFNKLQTQLTEDSTHTERMKERK